MIVGAKSRTIPIEKINIQEYNLVHMPQERKIPTTSSEEFYTALNARIDEKVASSELGKNPPESVVQALRMLPVVLKDGIDQGLESVNVYSLQMERTPSNDGIHLKPVDMRAHNAVMSFCDNVGLNAVSTSIQLERHHPGRTVATELERGIEVTLRGIQFADEIRDGIAMWRSYQLATDGGSS